MGSMLPMDEAEAKVSDRSRRPALVFEGAFAQAQLGDYPTEMTEHVFRSLAQSLGAAIHVSVTGDNDHPRRRRASAFGRALRQAIAIESLDLPSTKGDRSYGVAVVKLGVGNTASVMFAGAGSASPRC